MNDNPILQDAVGHGPRVRSFLERQRRSVS